MKCIKTIENENGLVLKTDLPQIKVEKEGNYFIYTINRNYNAAYGFGEKYDYVNQLGKKVIIQIRERCFYQEDYSYCTFPFFTTPDGFGMYVNTSLLVEFDFTEKDIVQIKVEDDHKGIPDMYFFEGSINEIIKQFKDVTAPTRIFPKWILGAWLSSNAWSSRKDIEEQILKLKKTQIPHSVMVIERWSDLTTFYNWGQSQYKRVKGDEHLDYDDFDFSSSEWTNPKEMVEKLHAMNIKVLLWDLPVFVTEKSIEGPDTEQRYIDNAYIVDNKECVMTKQGVPYTIPEGNWFYGSMIPDFSNEDCVKHWFNHREHLLQIGIDGFKTDGGEFIYSTDVLFKNGETGSSMKNGYADSYIKAYHENMDEDKVIFSRAGYTQTAEHTITWAGDQESTWDEYRSILKAGLSAGLSGISNWTFDIAGFAGYLPSKGLYLRSMQTAALVPIMQWHSEPITNGRCDSTNAWKNNDRSPWNISEFHKDEGMVEQLKRIFNLHYNLIPYLYALTLYANETGIPVMRHLVYEFNDKNVYDMEDQYMLGDALLVAPILEDYMITRKVYLPEGNWYDIYTNQLYTGKKWIEIDIEEDKIPLFVRENKCIAVNLDDTLKLASYVGNELSEYKNLCFIISGVGNYTFKDDLGNEICFDWNLEDINVKHNEKGLKIQFIRLSQEGVKLW